MRRKTNLLWNSSDSSVLGRSDAIWQGHDAADPGGLLNVPKKERFLADPLMVFARGGGGDRRGVQMGTRGTLLRKNNGLFFRVPINLEAIRRTKRLSTN